MTITDIDILVYVWAFGILGSLTLFLGYYLHGRIDHLIDDPNLPDRLSDDERDYRQSQLSTGVLTLYVAGAVLVLAALGLYVWGV
jgi:hypothetical protein